MFSRFGFALFVCAALAAQEYKPGPDSERQPNVPRGTVTQHSWTSRIFPGTVRDYWVYAPAQYTPDKPAAVMVFQDGGGYVKEDGTLRVPIVFDNLIARGEMPVTIGIFINPGVMPAPGADQQARFNRSYEYDSIGDRYARFLLEEILPEVGKSYNLTKDPNLRGIGGASSGGICAFTVAWERPDVFRRVLSFIGSFTDLRGGNSYPDLIRKSETKPLRVYLQDGSADLDIYAGSWWMANQDMAAALKYAGYDYQFVTGVEGHNSKHASAVLPDAMRWLWRDWTKPIARVQGQAPGDERGNVPVFFEPGRDWEIVSQGHKFTEGPAVNEKGEVYFTDIPNNRIYKVGLDSKVSLFKEDSGGANGTMFDRDGRLYVCQDGRKRVVAYAADGTESVIADGVHCNDLAVTPRGQVYFTDPPGRKVWFVDAAGNKKVVNEGLSSPNGVRLSADHSMLLVADYATRFVWSFQIQGDGSLLHGEPFYRLEIDDNGTNAAADGMTVDAEGYLYVATRAGIQVCDQMGRVQAILDLPGDVTPSNMVFGGPNLSTLYVTAVDKVYRRAMRRKGTLPWVAVKPPQPRM